MSATIRGKLIREDWTGRGADWPSYPPDRSRLHPASDSTSIVCSLCQSPTGGLRYDAPLGQFIHSDRRNCAPRFASTR